MVGTVSDRNLLRAGRAGTREAIRKRSLCWLYTAQKACGRVAQHMWLCLMEAKVIHGTLKNQMSRVPQAIHRTWVFPILRLCSCVTSDELSSHLRLLRGRAQILGE